MKFSHEHRMMLLAALAASLCCGAVLAQQVDEDHDEDAPPPGMMMPGAPGAAPAQGAGPSAEEIEALRAEYESLSETERTEMRAYYADMGVNLDALLGLSAARTAQVTRATEITMAMREMNFQRTPQAVLSARAELGFGRVPHPNAQSAPAQDIARWIHLHVMAGDWATLAQFLGSRPDAEAEALYAFIVQSLNRGDPGLLPEEVLALAEASPTEFKAWQTTALGAMLGVTAKKHSVDSLLARIGEGTRWFGPQDAQRRRRTVEFLAGGGLVIDAYDYLPPLDEARAAGDAEILLVHARYKHDLASNALAGAESDAARLDAWDLFCEVSLMARASSESKREAMRHAIGMMNRVPRARVNPWLTSVFASDSLGPVALEIMAMTAVAIGDSQQDVEQRAQAVLTLKEGVDILLAREEIDSSTLRVPLRMLTTALVAEMENTSNRKGQQHVVARDAQLLLRAVPSKRWLDALEPSLATRVARASISLAMLSDETDMALKLLHDAIGRSPTRATELADHFLDRWQQRLSPAAPDYDDEMYWYYRQFTPMAPLTRGRQRRNLDRLDALIGLLRESGVDPRALPSVVSTFQACHARTEVYERADIVRVLGEIDAMPPSTAAGLAQSMGASLNGDWRSRTVQRQSGTKRSDTEIALLVDRGYALALELIESAVANEPDSWRHAVVRAGLTYDRMQFQQSQGRIGDAARQIEYQRDAFDAFAQAARRYAEALERGDERDDPGIYRRWFGAAMGAAELSFLRVDDLPREGSLQDDQIALIRASIESLPEEARERHFAEFTRFVQAAAAGAAPEVKPRLVTHALRVVGDHPAAASLRAMDELYRDLVKDEIKLRLALDGTDRVGVEQPFGVLVSFRFTNSVDRETGGFSKYLQNGMWGRRGNIYTQINYRDELQKAIETSLSKRFNVEAIGFFDAFMPSRGVVEEGQDGWLEKPLAYVVLTRKDPSIDRLPPIVLDMQFNDQNGPVTLAVSSNTPLLAIGTAHERRPVHDLSVAQVVDLRDVASGSNAAAATLEVRMRGKGVLPDVRDVLAGLEDALPGYSIAEGGVEAQPPVLLQEGTLQTGMFGWGAPTEPKDGYPEPDADGMYRLGSERIFTVTYTPGDGQAGRAFRVPTLRDGIAATLETRRYDDFDIVPVSSASIAIAPSPASRVRLIVAALAVVLVAAGAAFAFLRRSPRLDERTGAIEPPRMTPLGVVTSLRRLHAQRGDSLDRKTRDALLTDIRDLELKYFGPGAAVESNGDLRPVVERWSRELAGPSRGV